MEKDKEKNLLIYILTIFILLISLFSITEIYIRSKDKIKRQMLRTSIEEIQKLSGQIKKTVYYEMEDFVYMLEIIEKSVNLDFDSLEKSIETLKNIEKKGTFTTLGIVNNKGEGLNTSGHKIKFNMEKAIKNFSKLKNSDNYYFVSNVLSEKDKNKREISIAIPIYKNEKLEGIIFGRQPIEKMAEKINSYLKNGLYFQIIDGKGNYVDHSFNEASLSDGELPLWKELEKHKDKLEKGYTIEKIKDDVQNNKKGFFILNDDKGGRYVVYEPLGINRWYIISVITKEELTLKSREFQKISKETLHNIILLILFITGTITGMSYYVYRIIKKQSDKNRIFKILANKTKDIFFEIYLSEQIFILYNFSEDKKTVSFPLEIISPENMLSKNKIKERDLENYKKFYKDIFDKKNIDKFIIELGIGNIWRWYRISSIAFNKDNMIGILENFTEEHKKGLEIVRINEKSKYDFLTTLYNREAFEKEFDNFVKKELNPDKISTLIILDLDNFKKVNDTLGHNIGDTVLKETSNILKSNLRSPDIIGRLGGDEFVILIKNVDSLEIIQRIADRLNKNLIKTYSKDNQSVTVSSSIGITKIKKGISFKESYEKADKALYKVKNSGRNSYFID